MTFLCDVMCKSGRLFVIAIKALSHTPVLSLALSLSATTLFYNLYKRTSVSDRLSLFLATITGFVNGELLIKTFLKGVLLIIV